MNSINLNTIDFNGKGGSGGSIVLPTMADFPLVGAKGMIYIDNATKLSYFWDDTNLMYQGIRSANRNPTPGPETDEGVYIKYTDGTISAPDVLIQGKTPVGVAYYSNNLKIVMHPQLVGKLQWQGGKDACVNMIFADGSQGRMPNQVELNAFCVNREQVNIALTTIGGNTFNGAKTWSASSVSNDNAWVVENTTWSNDLKRYTYNVRAVCDF